MSDIPREAVEAGAFAIAALEHPNQNDYPAAEWEVIKEDYEAMAAACLEHAIPHLHSMQTENKPKDLASQATLDEAVDLGHLSPGTYWIT